MRMLPIFIGPALLACSAAGSGGHHGNGDGGGTGSGSGDGGGTGSGSADARPGAADAGTQTTCTNGLGAWTGHDNVAASQNPPCGLAPDAVPQFVSIGFDDNAYSGLPGTNGTGGITWALDMLKARNVHASFYLSSIYIDIWESESPTFVKRAWHRIMTDGNEIANHTVNHGHGAMYDAATWTTEMNGCIASVTKPFDPNESDFSPDNTKGIGATKEQLVGFRTPFLEYDDATFTALGTLGYHYDCSIEDGWQEDQDGTNYFWPYTLDSGSPGNEVLVGWGSKEHITNHPGLWELPVSPVIVPPDDKCAQYGVPPGLRAAMHDRQSWFDVDSGKITGFDYNLWVSFRMTKAEFLATMKYTLDLRLAGNRAPFMFGAHPDTYSSKYTAVPNASLEERQQAIEEFLDYALSKPEVRVVPNQEILSWVRNPVPL